MDASEAFARKVLARAVKRGAKQAEVYLETSRQSSVSVRDGEVEDLSQATSKGLGLRVIAPGGRLGFAYTSDFDPKGADAFAEKALALSKVTAPDPRNVLPDRASLKARNRQDLQLYDPAVAELSDTWKLEAAREMEHVARGVDGRIQRFDSVGAGDFVSEVFIASSEGLADRSRGTFVYLYAQPVAAADGQLQVGSWSESRRFLSDLPTPAIVGRTAAERAIRMLGAKKVPSQRVPVVLDPQMAASFIGSLAGAINGDMVYKGASFLRDRLGKSIAPPFVSVVDDGLLERGLATSPFDGEGLPTATRAIVEGGVLQTFLYDTYTARKAKARSTASASRGYSSLPSIGSHNFYLRAGTRSPESIIGEVKQGLYVTGMLGRGANTITGEYSRGATGMWIENGELAYPVQELTVAGDLVGMLQGIDAVGNDLVFRSSVASPTLRFGELTVSGS
jgi:PmbA protein